MSAADHRVPGIRHQRGPVAMCRQAGCGREVRWDVMADQWRHTLTVAEHEAAQAATTEAIVAMMRGLAGALEPLRAGAPSPDQVERYLRGGKRV